jgi:protein-S-isoprenylcysteine O-methyltransferase Ste14
MISKETFILFVELWIGIAILLFPVLLNITAPYGRHSKITWGPMIKNRLAWFLMELPALVLFGFFIIRDGGLQNRVVLVAFILWMIHYVNRTLIFPIRIKTNNKNMPLVIAGMAFFFNLVNGTINGYGLGSLTPAYPDSWFYDPRFIAGIILFIAGLGLNHYSDHLLIMLRKNNGNQYKIPQGGLFRYISCPNFLGEIIEWGGFALLSWSLPALSFFIWTSVNLIPRALDHHRWYKSQFADYPVNRKAVLPFLF